MVSGRSEEETARSRLRAELERLRRRAEEEERKARQQHKAAAAADAAARAGVPDGSADMSLENRSCETEVCVSASLFIQGPLLHSPPGPPPASHELIPDQDIRPSSSTQGGPTADSTSSAHLRRSLKVTWDPSAYSKEVRPEDLREALSSHGIVEDIILRDRWVRAGVG